MPYMKALSGHSVSVGFLADYLTKGDRDIARDFLNVAEVGLDGVSWDRKMDLTRAALGTDSAYGSKGVRRYEHIIVSVDEKDDVALDDFRDFVCDWASRWFDDRLGRYQVAVVYHDDNSERLAAGKGGLLHAHIVVNNAELETSTRLSGKLTRKVVQEMRYDLNRAAAELGWHAFATDGRSMTLDEMRREGLEVSRGRAYDSGIDRLVGDVDISTHTQVETPSGPYEVVFPEAAGEVATARERPNGRPAEQREVMGERKSKERAGHSWKQDIRDRVDVSLRLAQNGRDFRKLCELQGLTVTFNRKGEIKYGHPSAPTSRVVLGPTLGDAYSMERIASVISTRHVSRAQRATASGADRHIGPSERVGILQEVLKAEVETQRGTRTYGQAREIIAYNDAHGIRAYEDYPADSEGARMCERARALKLFDAEFNANFLRQGPARDDAEALERAFDARQARGWGGPDLAQGSDSGSREAGAGGREDAERQREAIRKNSRRG